MQISFCGAALHGGLSGTHVYPAPPHNMLLLPQVRPCWLATQADGHLKACMWHKSMQLLSCMLHGLLAGDLAAAAMRHRNVTPGVRGPLAGCSIKQCYIVLIKHIIRSSCVPSEDPCRLVTSETGLLSVWAACECAANSSSTD